MLAVASIGFVGCATPTPPPAPAPAQPSLEELMQRAQSSAKEGRREAARIEYREAAKAYPAVKAPWVKLAEDYFEASDYGNAILAAQEVQQRDPQDILAQSILAVSGLRVSSSALIALRDQTSGVPSSTRDQAEALTRTLREALGETILVPRAEPPPPVPRPRTNRPRPSTAPQAAPLANPAAGQAAPLPPAAPAAAAKPPAASPAPAPAPAANPFEKPK
jgi:tetratricopeptide (TPR) repeat protein